MASEQGSAGVPVPEACTEAASTPRAFGTEGPSSLLPPQHRVSSSPESIENIEVDDDFDDDSAFEDVATMSRSLTDSILKYRTIHGRTYHSERGNAQYCHHVMSMMLRGRLFQAPLSGNIQQVADVGTGTGLWAIDFAEHFPGASVVGTDVSPIQPDWVPPNLQFIIDDCTQDEWSFRENSQDYIHMRLLIGSIIDWPALFRQAFKALKPGGWIESHEASPVISSDDNTIKDRSAMQQWGPIFFQGGEIIGRSFSILEDNTQRTGMAAAGFVNINESNHKVPIGGWPKDPHLREMGRYFQAAISNDIEGTLIFMASVLGWKKEQVDVFGAQYRREIRDRNIHAYFKQRIVWAQKPVE